MKKITLILALLSASLFAEGPGWITNRTIKSVVGVINGGINIRLDPELTNCNSQSGFGVKYASIYPDHLGIKNFSAIALTALSTGQKVSIYLTDNTCKITEIVIGEAP